MSAICLILILLGLVVLGLFTGLGFLIAHSLISSELFMSLLQVTPSMAYLGAVGACSLIGLLICISLVMDGLIYNRLGKLQRRHKRKHEE